MAARQVSRDRRKLVYKQDLERGRELAGNAAQQVLKPE